MSVQFIAKDGQPEWAVLPYAEYAALVEAAEMLADIRAYDEAKARIAAGEETIPAEVTFALLEGANPIAVWRKHRNLTQQALAAQVGISKAYLSQLESGKRSGTTEMLARLAQALRVDLDDLM
jgi:DNA-binding XRE family transcriptional regulator